MTAAAAIRAAFAEWRMVKSRKVLQLVFEVPLETQGEVLTTLGAPMPDAEIWCGIARLASLPPAGRPGVETGSSPTDRARASALHKSLDEIRPDSPMRRARTRAVMLCKDERFRAWACEQKYGIDEGRATLGEDLAAQFIRDTCCDGGSRKLIAEDPEAYRKFLALERLFHEAIGVIPEMRS